MKILFELYPVESHNAYVKKVFLLLYFNQTDFEQIDFKENSNV